jgi:aryl-alcohol dehydrogenase-like predicted oxidoreductase
MSEIVRAFNYVIEKGKAFYWGTSEWPAQLIIEAHNVADKLNLIPPLVIIINLGVNFSFSYK